MEDQDRMYRLNSIAHVAENINQEPTRCICCVRRQQNMPLHERIIPYLKTVDLYHLARLNSHWLWVDGPLLSAFIERWHPETHTFHMPFGECTITLHDMKIFGELPPPNKVKQMTVHFTWFHERFWVLPTDASEETVCIYAHAYIMMLLSSQLFGDKIVNRIHL
ncbi:uncharacterized protein DS421_9g272200 [Arachis hypogaea]|nr:uncharacterized protein DS421_9g272200 [Arachis hypogaea]